MKKLIKLMILLILSLSVYLIYNKTKNSTYNITNIGDKLSMGINSYGIKDYSYSDYLKDELKKTKNKIIYNNQYTNKEQTIFNLTNTIKNTSNIKNLLSESDIIVLTVGNNDLLFYLSIEDNLDEYKYKSIIKKIEKNYNELIKEIRKYYHEKIIVVSYPIPSIDDNINIKGINDLNNILKNNKEVIYIDTNKILDNKEKYFSNPRSFLPNNSGYYEISKEIIRKVLEK